MPFISSKEYSELLSSKKQTNSLKDQVEGLKREAELAESRLAERDRTATVDKEIAVREAVESKTQKLTDENLTLMIQNKELAARVNVVEKAFENLGFDVKDMKDILNKLVDGLISKNTINVVK